MNPDEKYWGPGEVVGGVRLSRRRALLVRAYLRVTSEGKTGREALVAAADAGGMGGMVEYAPSEKARRMEKLLAHPDVKLAIRGVYAEIGLELPEAVEIHAKHIRGFAIEQQTVSKDGEVVYFKESIPPNYAALRDYLKATTPQEPKRLNILTARVPAPREVRTDGSPPPMAARPIGDIVDPE